MHSSIINYHLRGALGFWGCYSHRGLDQTLARIRIGWLIVHVEEHWVVLYVQGKTLIILETLGTKKGNLRLLARDLVDYHIYVNNARVQSDLSDACGLYCILFVKLKISCLCTFNQYLSLFSSHHLIQNDVILYQLLIKMENKENEP